MFFMHPNNSVGIIKSIFIGIFFLCFPSSIYQSSNDSDRWDGEVGFRVQFREEIISHTVMGVFILPDEHISIRAWGNESESRFILEAGSGHAAEADMNRWIWRAPEEPGLYPVRIVQPQNQESITLNIFVMVPIDRIENGLLNGYRIGNYPKERYKNLLAYTMPAGLIEVTEENKDVWVSPHFRLGQFVCKGDNKYPKYLVLQERLLLKLERIQQYLHHEGFGHQALRIMSGYRTPHYNRIIGNGKYSRHIYGAAVDVFIDIDPKDGKMDDLNMDGCIDFQDAKILYDRIDSLFGDGNSNRFLGGLGVYDGTASHGPFVHVDVRGYQARWGSGSG
jgi:hypothetical protein